MARFFVFALAAAWLALAAVPAWAARQPLPTDGTIIREIQVEGTDQTSEFRILRTMELREGEPFRADAMRRDLQAIADIGSYNPLTLSVRSEEMADGIRLIVTVTENPTVRLISFVGNITYNSDKLRAELDFKEGDLLPLAARSTIASSLRAFYANGGHKSARIRVNIDAVEGEENAVNVQINVDEGEKIKVKDLIIHGNNHYSSIRLRMASINSGSWLIFDNYYDDRAFDDDLRAIEALYQDAGFLDARARRGEFIYDQVKAWVSPVIEITEGPRYKVRAVEMKGHTYFTDAEVNGPFVGLPGKYYDGDKFREAIERLRRLYGDQGYINAEFDGKFEKEPESGFVTLRMSIKENDVVFVGKINVQKVNYVYDFDLNPLEEFIDWTSPGVKDDAVMREVKLTPGQKYRTVDEVRTAERLRALGFFEKVNVRREPTANPQVNDAVIEVEEDPGAGFFGVTAGVGELAGPAVGAQYVNPNLFGDARVIRLNATIGRDVSGYGISYLDRHFKDSDNSLELSAYRDEAEYSGYGQRIYGVSGEVGTPFSEYVKLYSRLRLEHVRLEPERDDLKESMDEYHVVALRELWTRDLRNDRRWTTRGYKVSAGPEVGYADGPLMKALHSLEWYKSLSKDEDWVYQYAHNVGLMPVDADEIGLSERFFMGGTSSIRGFAPRGAGPKDEGAKGVSTGGATLLTQRHELRHRFNRTIQGRVFVDAGMLSEDAFGTASPRVGTGTGISLNMGAIVVDVDLAAAVVKRDRDRTRVIHFRLRSNF